MLEICLDGSASSILWNVNMYQIPEIRVQEEQIEYNHPFFDLAKVLVMAEKRTHDPTTILRNLCTVH